MSADILKDFRIAGTPLRGLVLRGEFCLLAYVGVPDDHWLADLDELEFHCHWGITFRGKGDGVLRPEGWYWYGWDYGHAFDVLEPSKRLLDSLNELPPEARAAVQAHMFTNKGRKLTPEAVEADVVDSAQELLYALRRAEDQARAASTGLVQLSKQRS